MNLIEAISYTNPNMIVDAWGVFIKYKSLLLIGVRNTLIVALVGTLVGLLIGLVIGAVRAVTQNKEASDSKFAGIIKKIGYILTSIYVSIFRGTPMMVQAMFLFYALKPILNWSAISAACVIISINTGAYMAEIIRSGIQSVDRGQSEAARSIGMTSMQTMRYVILPQAIKNAFPSIGNEFIVNIKDSSVLSVIGFSELFWQAKSIAGSTFSSSEPFLVVAVMYFILTYTTALILNYFENRINHTKSSFPASQTVEDSTL